MIYQTPHTVAEAVACLQQYQHAKILAGGTDLLVQMRNAQQKPEALIDIKQISESRTISIDDGKLVVGAAVSGAELNEHLEAKALWPGLAEAFDLIGSTQIQGRASLGGNLCNASPAADSVPALIAAGAIAHIVGPNGERKLAVEDVNAGPGQNNLKTGEFILNFHFPKRLPKSGDAYLRFIPRTEMDIAVVGVGINLALDDQQKCSMARVALGAAAPTALLVEDAATALIGNKIDDVSLNNLSKAVSAACKPINDKRGTIEYRTKVAGVLARRVAVIALERAQA